MSDYHLFLGDCLDIMPQLEKGSIQAAIADIPYGTTSCTWDSTISFVEMWGQLERITEKSRAIVLFSSQPFTSALVMSNPKMFKYALIWDKTYGRQPQLANIQPMKRHEDILIYGTGRLTYNPQKEKLLKPYTSSGANNSKDSVRNDHKLGLKKRATTYTHKTPDSVLQFKPFNRGETKHPTQKPVPLMGYLIKTYTNENETVLDNTMGSETTGVACVNTNRNFIGIEMDDKYFGIAEKRIKEAQSQTKLF